MIRHSNQSGQQTLQRLTTQKSTFITSNTNRQKKYHLNVMTSTSEAQVHSDKTTTLLSASWYSLPPNYRKSSKFKKKEARFPCRNTLLQQFHRSYSKRFTHYETLVCLLVLGIDYFISVSTGIYFIFQRWRLVYLYFTCVKVWNLTWNISYPFPPRTTYSPCLPFDAFSLWNFPICCLVLFLYCLSWVSTRADMILKAT